ncbi:MAG: hypothetical protein M2R45_04273 [Verrucomicrobia subdivision 3 bacterium]|nr:hypothetical protein [Limisphaerales bacterium]MCS1417380.1 hypothetical protein [Limisphaerales bacterium]
MSFLSLSALWFALTIPVVIFFYLLKRRRKLHLVSSTVLWQRFLAESQANAPFQKLRRNLLLFLQLLMLTLAVLGLARPYLADRLTGGALQVLVMDASASMQSTDVTPSRFAVAQELALELVDGLKDTDQMVVVASGARTAVVQSPSSEKAVLRRAIRSIEVSDAPTRLLEGLRLAETLVRDHPSSEIHLLSDGAVSDLGEFEETDLNLRYHQIGESGNNVGLVSMDVRPNPDDPLTRAVFASVVNYSTNEFRFPAELRLDEQMIELRLVTVEGGGSLSLAFIARQTKDGVFSLSLGVDDDLAVDNEVQVISLLPEPADVLLYSGGNAFLERALRSTEVINLRVSDDGAEESGDHDIVVVDSMTPLEWPRGNVMVINTMHTNWFASWGQVEAPAIVDWKSSHPLLRFVSFDDVEIGEAFSISVPFWGESIVESSQSPLIVAGEQGGQRRLWIGFDIIRSTWPLRVSFPMFIGNAVQWLNPSVTSGQDLTVRTGAPVRVGYESSGDSVSVLRPNGETERLPWEPSMKSLVYGNTMAQGLYVAGEGTNQVKFAANLMDAAESDSSPRAALTLAGGRQVTASVGSRADLEVWRWIVALALAVLMFEWWWYHKRTA